MYNTLDPNYGYNHRRGGFIHSGYVFTKKKSHIKSSLVKFIGLLDGEVFKQSEYENIKVSNKGRVLILEEGEWKLATFPKTVRYYAVYVNDVDEKRRHIMLHHLVYFTFQNIKIEPIPDGYCIMYKDGDTHNNCIENLIYTTTSECSINSKYNLGRSITKPVNQYTLDGKYLYTYPSTEMAAATINGNSSIHSKADSINKCANGFTYKSYGYQWRFTEDIPEGIDIDPATIAINGKRKRIAQYTTDGNLVKIWECGRDVMRAFDRRSPSSVYKCANGLNKTAWGYVWKWV